MAEVSELITLGIGTPSGIGPLTLFGLSTPGGGPAEPGPNEMISLGIGEPAGITPFILFGLSSEGVSGGAILGELDLTAADVTSAATGTVLVTVNFDQTIASVSSAEPTSGSDRHKRHIYNRKTLLFRR
jgi:hypothetical protein